MLILYRRTASITNERSLGESVTYIGDDVAVSILGVDAKGSVRIGIEAPVGVPVLRHEVAARKGALPAVASKIFASIRRAAEERKR